MGSLIARHIDSVQQVEILALLRHEAERAWTAEQVGRALRIAPSACSEWLDRFATAGMVELGETGYRHATRNSAGSAVDDLVDLYVTRRTSVIDAIHRR